MDYKEIRKMRGNQLLVTNVIIFLGVLLFFTVAKITMISISQYFVFLGILLAIRGIIGLVKGETTKSVIPIFEKIAVYEKGKMGSEWYKERKTNFIGNIMMGGFMFLQAYWNHSLSEQPFELDVIFMITLLLFILLLINIASVIRFRKIDRSINSSELKGYTRKSNLIGAVVGIIFGVIIAAVTIFLIVS
ncbi:hypothetical protein DOE78_03820 [Bacillus sp. Y1]|nr:hypothetical protein [Bacillus sp. Y1]AYA74648.1 hypothetical protein DOE78_03820 [Bacillus sp. Y1]